MMGFQASGGIKSWVQNSHEHGGALFKGLWSLLLCKDVTERLVPKEKCRKLFYDSFQMSLWVFSNIQSYEMSDNPYRLSAQ